MNSSVQAYRGGVLHFNDDPAFAGDAYHWHQDGLLIVDDGRVVAAGDHAQLAASLPQGATVHDLRGKLILPGFIDTHIHYPQSDMIASPAPGLLPWLETYTFPTERKFQDPEHAGDVARFFLDELARNGTTTAMVYCTVHPESVDAFFTESSARNMRMVAGKVMMDRNCPAYLADTAESGARDSEALIQRWHNKGRQAYALTPRFAPTSTEAQLALTGELARAYPDTYIQSHVAENTDEIAWSKPCIRRRAAISMSTTVTACCASGPCTATASTSTTPTAPAWSKPAPPLRCARPPTCSSAAACSISPPPTPYACRCRWPPTSAAAPRFRCCG